MKYLLILIIILTLLLIGCYGGTKVLEFKPNEYTATEFRSLCYKLDPKLKLTGRIYSTLHLDNKNNLSSFHYWYSLENIFKNLISIDENCNYKKETVVIKELNIFRKSASDTAEWRASFFVELKIDYVSDNYIITNESFKGIDNTGWIKVFRFNKPKNDIITEAIQRALVHIFTDIEDAIENKLTLEQRNAKKDKDRLETEKLMDKYIKAQKALE